MAAAVVREDQTPVADAAGDEQVEIEIAVDVAELEIADARGERGQVSRADFRKAPVALAEVEAALRLVGRA